MQKLNKAIKEAQENYSDQLGNPYCNYYPYVGLNHFSVNSKNRDRPGGHMTKCDRNGYQLNKFGKRKAAKLFHQKNKISKFDLHEQMEIQKDLLNEERYSYFNDFEEEEEDVTYYYEYGDFDPYDGEDDYDLSDYDSWYDYYHYRETFEDRVESVLTQFRDNMISLFECQAKLDVLYERDSGN